MVRDALLAVSRVIENDFHHTIDRMVEILSNNANDIGATVLEFNTCVMTKA